MRRSGQADLPLHGGRVPRWLAERMTRLGTAIAEVIVAEFGTSAFLRRISDPLWFQSFGCVLGMDWHSSGITTSVMGALKRGLQGRADELGLYVCGGRGRYSRMTPHELETIAGNTGLDGNALIRSSKLTAKIDNTAIDDGFQLYLHSFIVSKDGEWAVVQQGMNTGRRQARRYHWHSPQMRSFTDNPHTAVCGESQGRILNLVHTEAHNTRGNLLTLAKMHPEKVLREARYIHLPDHHDVRTSDVNLRRLGSVIALAHETNPEDFEALLLLHGLGPRTLQSLALVSEVIYGNPTRFDDPARFAFAHGGKDGHPFPVPLKVYDETIEFMHRVVDKAHVDHSEKRHAFKQLHALSGRLERRFKPAPAKLEAWIQQERSWSERYGGRTVMDGGPNASSDKEAGQLRLFD